MMGTLSYLFVYMVGLAYCLTMKITLSTLGGRTSYAIDDLPNNPPLIVHRGDRLSISVDTHPHAVVIKSGLGFGFGYSYGVKPGPNGIDTGTIEWEVSSEAPARLYYQSVADLNLWGVIEVRDVELDDGFRFVDLNGLENMSVVELVDIMNHNASIGLSKAQELGGYGIEWDGSQFKLEEGTTVYEDERGIFRSTRNVRLNDQVPVTGAATLSISDALNEIASQIRRVIGGESWAEEPADSIEGLKRRYEELRLKARALGNQNLALMKDYQVLLEAYNVLVAVYKNHSHVAQDIVDGTFDPARLAYGDWAEGKQVVVGENGLPYWY